MAQAPEMCGARRSAPLNLCDKSSHQEIAPTPSRLAHAAHVAHVELKMELPLCMVCLGHEWKAGMRARSDRACLALNGRCSILHWTSSCSFAVPHPVQKGKNKQNDPHQAGPQCPQELHFAQSFVGLFAPYLCMPGFDLEDPDMAAVLGAPLDRYMPQSGHHVLHLRSSTEDWVFGHSPWSYSPKMASAEGKNRPHEHGTGVM